MGRIGQKAAARITQALRKFQPIIESARARDVNESDTVVVVADILQELFGFDKYAEITSEYQIRSTYCDLAIKLGGRLTLLIEVKAIGLGLKDNHVKQAVDYGANQGCEWVLLTNGIHWQAYRVTFAKPIAHELVLDINLGELNAKKAADIEQLWLLSKEGIEKSSLSDYHEQREAMSRYSLAALILGDSVVDVLRRELRRINPDARIEDEAIRAVLTNEVLKREILEGEKAEAAKRTAARAAARRLRKASASPAMGAAAQSTEPTLEPHTPPPR